MTDVTVHITVPRQIWDTTGIDVVPESHDRIVGEFIREAAAEGESMVGRRVEGGIRVKHIEITLDDAVTSAVAE